MGTFGVRGFCRFFLIAGFLSIGVPSAAQAQSLDESLALAYWGNPTLRAERAALGALDHGVTEALAGWRPTISMALGRNRSYVLAHDSQDTRSTAILPSEQASLTLTQRIADFGQTSGAVRAAEARVLAGRATLAQVEQTILLETAEAYLGVVWGEQNLALNRANMVVLTRQWDAAQAGYDRQMTTLTDRSQAQARLANAKARLRKAEEDLDTARGRYAAVVGEMPGSLSFPPLPATLPDSRDAAMAEATRANPSVQNAEYTLEAARAAVESAEAGLLPVVNLEASDAYSTNTSVAVSDQRVQTLGVVVRMPLYQGGAEYARIQARKQDLGQRRQQVDAARRSVRQQALQHWNALAAAAAQADSFETSVQANQIARDGVAAEHLRLGTRTLLDVLNAEQELFEARINRIGAQRDHLTAAYRILAATGRMNAQALALAVVRYDPVRHYDDVRGSWIGWGDRDSAAGEDGAP